MPSLEFSQVHHYNSTAGGISVSVVLRSGGNAANLLAYLDTGAANCLFERKYGEMLKLEIEAGDRRTFSTVAGGVDAFGHFVELEVYGLKFESLVYFFGDERIEKNVLGRAGWLDRIRLGLIDYDCELYLAAYDHPAARAKQASSREP
jgi:hypothetical protein